MQSSFVGLGVGLAMAIVLVYLLIVVNFQSWIDAAIIVAALPAALAGIAWMLFITGTTLERAGADRRHHDDGRGHGQQHPRRRVRAPARAGRRRRRSSAALEAGATRIRPVLMTALAMIIGMIPMALGLGEGAEQNAPLGRAVIGGLIFATVSTLFFVPVVYAGVHRRLARRASRVARARRTPPLALASGGRKQCLTNVTRRSASIRRTDRTITGELARATPGRATHEDPRGGRAGAARAGCGAHGGQPHVQHARAGGRHRGARQALREGHDAQVRRRRADAVAARHAAGLRAVADRRTRQRLPAALVQGHRQPRRKGRAPGRNRNAGNRPAAVAGDRRAPAGRREPRSREEHGRALGKPAQARRRVAAGARRAAQRQHAGRGQSRGGRRQRRAPAPARRLQAHRRAVRGRDHPPQRRRRRPDRRRQQRRPRAVPARADRSAARLRQRAADVFATRQARPEGRRHAGRAARTHVRRRGGAHVRVDRHHDAHDADRGRAAEPRRRPAARRVRAGRVAAGGEQVAVDSHQRADDSRRRHPRGGGRHATAACSLRPVRIGRNYGEMVEVLDGVAGTEQLVLNPSDSLADGDQVTIAAATPGKDAK